MFAAVAAAAAAAETGVALGGTLIPLPAWLIDRACACCKPASMDDVVVVGEGSLSEEPKSEELLGSKGEEEGKPSSGPDGMVPMTDEEEEDEEDDEDEEEDEEEEEGPVVTLLLLLLLLPAAP